MVDRAVALLTKFEVLIKILWLKVFKLIEKHIKDNVADTRLSYNEMKGLFHKVWDLNKQITGCGFGKRSSSQKLQQRRHL